MHIGKHIKKLVICSISTISSDHFLHTFVCAGLNVTLLRFTPPMQPLPPPSNKALWGIMGGEQGRRWIPTIEIKQVKQLNFKPYSGSYFNNAQKLWNLGKFNLHVFDSQKKNTKIMDYEGNQKVYLIHRIPWMVYVPTWRADFYGMSTCR